MFKKRFLAVVTQINDFILDTFSHAFNIVVILCLLTCIYIPFSKIGNLKIGGEDAKPLFSKVKWFAIVLCTTIATGILFWGTSEPFYHFFEPPNISSLSDNDTEKVYFSLSSLFLHWSFSPYAIYSIPALMFAIAYYNKEQGFSLGSSLFTLFNLKQRIKLGVIIDNLSMFALIMGMSASLGAGILSLRGGILKIFDTNIDPNIITLIVALVIVLSFIISASTGLLKGIKNLSFLNLIVFVILLVIVLFNSDLRIFDFILPSLKQYATTLATGNMSFFEDADWVQSWTIFYWANWMAWAPITALFLGRLSYGRTVKEFMLVNWVLPSLFAIFWMSVFGGNLLFLQHEGIFDFAPVLYEKGPEAIVYSFFRLFPFSTLMIILFIFTTYISYVTAADSNTEALGGISSLGISPDSPSPSVKIKILWGVIIGATAITAINFAGVKGIKMVSNLGGLPSLFLLFFILISLWVYMFKFKK